jgi:nitronate monooxygenase
LIGLEDLDRVPLTRQIYQGIQTPIIAAPMAGASGGALAAAVTLGGGFGFLAAGE